MDEPAEKQDKAQEERDRRLTNIFLLVFNLLPFYPLDGGQIVRALLWFRLGPIRSLTVAGALGIAGSACLGVWAVISTSIWIGLLAFFLFTQASSAIGRAKAMALEQGAVAPPAPAAPPQAGNTRVPGSPV